jgi:hypothetical protein
MEMKESAVFGQLAPIMFLARDGAAQRQLGQTSLSGVSRDCHTRAPGRPRAEPVRRRVREDTS